MDNKPMTSKEMATKYQINMGDCPLCGSEDGIVVEDRDYAHCIVYENCHCSYCRKQFTFKYELTEIINEDTEVSNG